MTADDEKPARSFTKIEWWDICRRLVPALTWDEFEDLWDEFIALKKSKESN